MFFGYRFVFLTIVVLACNAAAPGSVNWYLVIPVLGGAVIFDIVEIGNVIE